MSEKIDDNVREILEREVYGAPYSERGGQYRDEAVEKYGLDTVTASEQRIREAGAEEFERVKAEGDAIVRKLAGLMDKDPADPEVQQAVDEYYRHMHFYMQEIPLEMFRGWGEMYTADPRFRATYEAYAEGLADYLGKAIKIYCTGD